MEYSRSFAMIEAAVLVAVTLWLFYLNASSTRRDADTETAEQDTPDRQDESDHP